MTHQMIAAATAELHSIFPKHQQFDTRMDDKVYNLKCSINIGAALNSYVWNF